MKNGWFHASILMFVCGLSSVLAAGEEVLNAAFTSRAGPNRYVVQMPRELGGETLHMPIVGGSFQLAVDADAGTSRLLAWRQEIAPISIFGASTGPITVSLDPAQESFGIYQAERGTFSVTAGFVLAFDDSELIEFGFASPFVLTATENGTIYGAGKIGKIAMVLEGSGRFSLGEFTYTCETSAEFIYDLPEDMGQPGDVNHDLLFDISDPVAGLRILFQGDDRGCPGAIEVNEDGQRDISDMVYMLGFLFLGGPAPQGEPVECRTES